MISMKSVLIPKLHTSVRVMSALFYIIVFGAVCSCTSSSAGSAKEPASNTLQRKVDSLLAGKPMQAGVAVSYHGNMICSVNPDNRFPMMSVFKLHQAIAVLDSVQHSAWEPDTKIRVTKEMLHENTYSPMRDEYPEGNIELSLEQLLRYSLLMSDNNACDILFSRFGGTSYVQSKMLALNLHDTQIKWTEDDMHQDTGRAADNYTTPREAVAVLSEAYVNVWLRRCLTECRTGQNRIPALLPQGQVIIGHKTGTGDVLPDGILTAINDIGFVILPDGEPCYIAVFCSHSACTVDETESVIAEIAKMTYDYLI